LGHSNATITELLVSLIVLFIAASMALAAPRLSITLEQVP
jgi:hypothetical protein